MTTSKRQAEFCIDSNVMEGLKLIRYTASHIMKKIEASLPEEELKSCESNIMTALANIPRFLAGGSINDFSTRSRIRTMNSEKFSKEFEKSQLKMFLNQYFVEITNQIHSLKLQTKRLMWYGFRVRRQDVKAILAFISERPTVYRNLNIYVDKMNDQSFFLFREQKTCQLKKVEKLFDGRIEIELYSIKNNTTIPKKYDKAFEAEILLNRFVHGVTMTKPGFVDSLRKFKEAVLRAKIKDIELPKLTDKVEKEIKNRLKIEHHLTDERTYIPVRNDKLNAVHSRLGFMKNYSKNAVVEDDNEGQNWEDANDGEIGLQEHMEAQNPNGTLTTNDSRVNNSGEN